MVSAARISKVLIADDHAALRRGVRDALEGAGYAVCAEVGDAAAAVQAAIRERPDICLLEVRLPGGGIAAAEQISKELPSAIVVMLTGSTDDEDLFGALRAGASGYLLKDIAADRLPAALAGVLRGEAAISRLLVTRVIDEFRGRERRRGGASKGLREREREVLELLAHGKSTADIATLLEVDPATVRSHVSRALKALGVTTRSEALALLSAE